VATAVARHTAAPITAITPYPWALGAVVPAGVDAASTVAVSALPTANPM
jgi:hypothetical protein